MCAPSVCVWGGGVVTGVCGSERQKEGEMDAGQQQDDSVLVCEQRCVARAQPPKCVGIGYEIARVAQFEKKTYLQLGCLWGEDKGARRQETGGWRWLLPGRPTKQAA